MVMSCLYNSNNDDKNDDGIAVTVSYTVTTFSLAVLKVLHTLLHLLSKISKRYYNPHI